MKVSLFLHIGSILKNLAPEIAPPFTFISASLTFPFYFLFLDLNSKSQIFKKFPSNLIATQNKIQ